MQLERGTYLEQAMRQILGSGVFAAALSIGVMTASVVHAAPVVPTIVFLGALSGVTHDDSAAFPQSNLSGSFQNIYGFTLTNPYSDQFVVSISVTDGFSKADQVFSSLTLDLYTGLSGTGTLLNEANVFTFSYPSPFPGGLQLVGLSDTLSAGDYSFSLTGDVAGSNSYAGALSVSVSPVPLPASAPLLGLAILGLGAFGFAKKRRQAVSAA